MKNRSIRTRILAGVLIVNVLGAVAIVVYLHQSYSGGIDDTAARTASQGLAAWEQIKGPHESSLIPSWNRVIYSIPDIYKRLLKAVEKDNL